MSQKSIASEKSASEKSFASTQDIRGDIRDLKRQRSDSTSSISTENSLISLQSILTGNIQDPNDLMKQIIVSLNELAESSTDDCADMDTLNKIDDILTERSRSPVASPVASPAASPAASQKEEEEEEQENTQHTNISEITTSSTKSRKIQKSESNETDKEFVLQRNVGDYIDFYAILKMCEKFATNLMFKDEFNRGELTRSIIAIDNDDGTSTVKSIIHPIGQDLSKFDITEYANSRDVSVDALEIVFGSVETRLVAWFVGIITETIKLFQVSMQFGADIANTISEADQQNIEAHEVAAKTHGLRAGVNSALAALFELGKSSIGMCVNVGETTSKIVTGEVKSASRNLISSFATICHTLFYGKATAEDINRIGITSDKIIDDFEVAVKIALGQRLVGPAKYLWKELSTMFNANPMDYPGYWRQKGIPVTKEAAAAAAAQASEITFASRLLDSRIQDKKEQAKIIQEAQTALLLRARELMSREYIGYASEAEQLPPPAALSAAVRPRPPPELGEEFGGTRKSTKRKPSRKSARKQLKKISRRTIKKRRRQTRK